MLFLENSYLKEFETQIKKVHDDKIILNQTAFYAKSGGQPGDTGNIIFNDIIINIIDTIYDNNKNSYIKVFINGDWIGFTQKYKSLQIDFKYNRNHGLINIHSSISFDQINRSINIFSDYGRLIRPLLKVKENKLFYNQKYQDKLRNNKYKWI